MVELILKRKFEEKFRDIERNIAFDKSKNDVAAGKEKGNAKQKGRSQSRSAPGCGSNSDATTDCPEGCCRI